MFPAWQAFESSVGREGGIVAFQVDQGKGGNHNGTKDTTQARTLYVVFVVPLWFIEIVLSVQLLYGQRLTLNPFCRMTSMYHAPSGAWGECVPKLELGNEGENVVVGEDPGADAARLA